MPSPTPPSVFRELLPSSGGNFCVKFVKNLLRLFPERVYAYIAYERNEDGTIADGFAADIRALKCSGGTGPGGTGTLLAPAISASDGTYLDKVVISWPSVSGATSYELFRNNVDSVTTALSIGVVAVNSFDDVNADPGTTYYYWVKAINSTSVSAFSNSDPGFAAVEIAAIDTLEATRGFNVAVGGTLKTIRLVWTPPLGAQQYDIYRQSSEGLSVSANFTLATKVDSGRVPFDNSESSGLGPSPTFLNNDGEVVYFDTPPSPVEVYYYWVVSKGDNGTGMSTQSNQADGWAVGLGNGGSYTGEEKLDWTHQSAFAQGGAVRAWIVAFGSGGGGAGADVLHGGGGAGAGPMIWGEFIITGATPKFRVVYTPNELDTGRAPAQTDGDNGTQMVVQFAPDGSTWSTLMTTLAPGGGDYSVAGGGLGGAGSSGSKDAGLLRSGLRAGHSGDPAIGKKGGRSGYRFGGIRIASAHFGTLGNLEYAGDGDPAGSGSTGADLGHLAGGLGRSGFVLIFYQTF